MDFRLSADGKKSTGGSDGCVNFNDPDNKGLAECLQRFEVNKIYENYCEILSLADFIVIVAENVMARLETHYNPEDPFDEETMAYKFRE